MTIRVLLADPDETLLETYQAFLNRQGFDTCVVTTGESCLAALTTFAPDVLVLEPELAGSWGIRILSYLREQREDPARGDCVDAARRGFKRLHGPCSSPEALLHARSGPRYPSSG